MPGLARFEVTPLAWRLGFLYAALFVVVGCYLPYMPVWLHWRGLDEDAIALLLAAPLFARILFTPLISFAADWSGARRTVLIVLAWGSLSRCCCSGPRAASGRCCSPRCCLPSTGPPSCR
jgi:MFS family permease